MDTWRTRMDDLLAELELVGDWTDRYRQVVVWGEELEALAEAERQDADLVAGCSSPLWLRVRWTDAGLSVGAASTGVLPRGLAAVAVRLFDGLDAAGLADCPPAPALSRSLGFDRSLSPTRAVVFETMLARCLAGVPR